MFEKGRPFLSEPPLGTPGERYTEPLQMADAKVFRGRSLHESSMFLERAQGFFAEHCSSNLKFNVC